MIVVKRKTGDLWDIHLESVGSEKSYQFELMLCKLALLVKGRAHIELHLDSNFLSPDEIIQLNQFCFIRKNMAQTVFSGKLEIITNDSEVKLTTSNISEVTAAVVASVNNMMRAKGKKIAFLEINNSVRITLAFALAWKRDGMWVEHIADYFNKLGLFSLTGRKWKQPNLHQTIERFEKGLE